MQHSHPRHAPVLIFVFIVAFAECQLRGELQRWLARGLAVVGSIAALAALIVFVVTDPEDGRLNGLGQLDTHVIGALVFGVTLIFVLHVLMSDRARAWRGLASLSALFLVLAVVLSDSRNAWISVLLGVVIFVLAKRTRDVRTFCIRVAVAVSVIGVGLVLLLLDDTLRDMLLPRGGSFRVEIWSAALADVWSNGIVFGRGITTSDRVYTLGTEFMHPHSMYIAVLFQGGLIALGMFALVLYNTVRALLIHFDHPDAKLALGILAITLPAYVLDGHELIDKVGSTWFLFWLPVAISLGLRWNLPAR